MGSIRAPSTDFSQEIDVDPVDQLPPKPPMDSVDAAAPMTVPCYKLFSYADSWDYFLMLVGGLAAITHGASIPVFFIFFGRLLDTLGSATAIPTNLEEEARTVSLNHCLLCCGRFESA